MKQYKIESFRVKERFNKPISDITEGLGRYLTLEANPNGKIYSFKLKSGSEEKLIPTQLMFNQLQDIVFELGAEAIAEKESNIELHVEKMKADEVEGFIYADQLPLHQQFALGIKNPEEMDKLVWYAEVTTEWDDDIVCAHLTKVYVENGNKKILLSDVQYSAEDIEHSLTENYAHVYEEQRVSRFADWSSYYD